MQFPTKDKHGRERTAYAVICEEECGLVYLTKEEYRLQMNAANRTWRCQICRSGAYWSDDNYESFLNIK